MITLKRYQERGVRRIRWFMAAGGGALLADEMGLGKTIQALAWFQEVVRRLKRKGKKAGPAIIVCPSSVKWNWEREAAHFNLLAEVIDGTRPPRQARGRAPIVPDILVINYDILKPWLKRLRKLNPSAVIIDECHYIKNRGAKRYRWVKSLCRGVRRILAIGGTPLTNRPAEMWSTLNLLRPDIFDSFYSYGLRYCDPQRKPWAWEYKGATHLDELHAILKKTCMIRRLKSDVLDELPAKTRFVVPVALSKDARKEYGKAEGDFLSWLKRYYSSAKVRRANKAQRLVKHGYLKRLAGTLKLPEVFRWLDDLLEQSDGKVIVFAVHKKIISALRERYGKLAVVIDGSVTGRERQRAVDKFHRSKKVRMMIGNIQAAGVGWNGTVANTVVFAELGWTPGEHTQAEDRAHRMTQKKNVSIYYLVARGTVEEKLCKLIQKKQEVLSSTLDGHKANTLDIYKQLERFLLRA